MSSVNHHHHLNNNMAPPTGQPIATPGGRPQPPRVTGMYSNPILSSDEAPDTGDDSDEDVITSYLMQHGVAPPGTTGDQSSQSAGIATETPILGESAGYFGEIEAVFLLKIKKEQKKELADTFDCPLFSTVMSLD